MLEEVPGALRVGMPWICVQGSLRFADLPSRRVWSQGRVALGSGGGRSGLSCVKAAALQGAACRLQAPPKFEVRYLMGERRVSFESLSRGRAAWHRSP